PDINGDRVRRAYGLDGSFVIGFIGTFGPWHGAEVLARAYVQLRQRHPELRDAVRLLMIGDGARMAATRAILVSGGALDATAFTGLVPQDDGPEHLAAADLLVSPHVTNPDGTPFFGSPICTPSDCAIAWPAMSSRLGDEAAARRLVGDAADVRAARNPGLAHARTSRRTRMGINGRVPGAAPRRAALARRPRPGAARERAAGWRPLARRIAAGARRVSARPIAPTLARQRAPLGCTGRARRHPRSVRPAAARVRDVRAALVRSPR